MTDNADFVGVDLGERFEQIVEFSELGAFMDEPLRTYSNGMIMRLAFSVAINVDPDLLIIDEVLAKLRAQGIGTAEYVPCVHLQPFMRERYGFREGMFPVAEDACSRTVALPFFTQIDPEDQERVVGALSELLQMG